MTCWSGLIDPESNLSVNPFGLITEELIEVTEWSPAAVGIYTLRVPINLGRRPCD